VFESEGGAVIRRRSRKSCVWWLLCGSRGERHNRHAFLQRNVVAQKNTWRTTGKLTQTYLWFGVWPEKNARWETHACYLNELCIPVSSVPNLSALRSATRGDLVVPMNKATTRQPGIFCGWSVCLEQSTTRHSFGNYIINVQKRAQDTFFVRSYFTD